MAFSEFFKKNNFAVIYFCGFVKINLRFFAKSINSLTPNETNGTWYIASQDHYLV